MIPLKDLKLWWPAWQQGVPITSFGYSDLCRGEGYSFKVDKELDSFLTPDGGLMAIASARLQSTDGTKIPFNSFTVLPDGYTQVNASGYGGFTVQKYLTMNLFLVGDVYYDED